MVSRENFGRRSRTGSRPYLCQARARRLNRAWRDRRIGAGLRNRRSKPHGRPRRHSVLAEISSFFPMTPLGVATALWVIWALSWLLAAVWSSRTHSSAGRIAQLPYRLITTAGFVHLFGVNPGSKSGHCFSLTQSTASIRAALTAVGLA